MSPIETNPEKQTRLSEKEMEEVVIHIVFDLGVSKDQAREWAEEMQEKLLKEKSLVSEQTIITKVDAAHVDDEEVPAELTERDQSRPTMVDLAKDLFERIKKEKQANKPTEVTN